MGQSLQGQIDPQITRETAMIEQDHLLRQPLQRRIVINAQMCLYPRDITLSTIGTLSRLCGQRQMRACARRGAHIQPVATCQATGRVNHNGLKRTGRTREKRTHRTTTPEIIQHRQPIARLTFQRHRTDRARHDGGRGRYGVNGKSDRFGQRTQTFMFECPQPASPHHQGQASDTKSVNFLSCFAY